MANAPVRVIRSGPGPRDVKRKLAQLRRSQVLVGIPAENTQREGEGINNASVLYVFSKGSPLRGTPPRPVLEPAIEKDKRLITPELGAAGKAMFEENPTEVSRHLNRAGTIAANSAKRMFTDPQNGWAPNAPSTIRAKGSDRPGIDTGAMRRAITHVVSVDGRESQPVSIAGGLAEEAEEAVEGAAEIL